MMAIEIESAEASMFAAHLNSTFRFQSAPAPAELELITVSDASTPGHINFTLLFQGPPQPPLAQKIYSVEHDQLGRFDLFNDPIKRDPKAIQYEAIINSLVKAAS